MKPKNNKDFFEDACKIFYDLCTNRNEITDDYREYLTQLNPDSFDTLRVYLFLDSIKNEFLDSINRINTLIEQAKERFYQGLDLE